MFAALLAEGRIEPGTHEQHTLAGSIPVEVATDGTVWMQQPRPRFDLHELDRSEIAPLLGLDPSAIVDVASASTALRHVFVEVQDEATLAALRPDDEGLRTASGANGIDTIGVWCWQGGNLGRANVRVRDLCHCVGDPEEAASGTTNGALASHLHRSGRVRATPDGEVRVVAEQGFEMGRPSRVETALTIKAGAIAVVDVGGRAELRIEGRYLLSA
ncbi:MAG: PhzF family phenazine biosynthesis protein [Pseudomonadota bacterium]